MGLISQIYRRPIALAMGLRMPWIRLLCTAQERVPHKWNGSQRWPPLVWRYMGASFIKRKKEKGLKQMDWMPQLWGPTAAVELYGNLGRPYTGQFPSGSPADSPWNADKKAERGRGPRRKQPSAGHLSDIHRCFLFLKLQGTPSKFKGRKVNPTTLKSLTYGNKVIIFQQKMFDIYEFPTKKFWHMNMPQKFLTYEFPTKIFEIFVLTWNKNIWRKKYLNFRQKIFDIWTPNKNIWTRNKNIWHMNSQ